MLVGRTAELEYLNDYYVRDGSQQLVVYGQKYIGKTALMREFVKDKPCHYYMARACSEKEHRLALERLIREVEQDISKDKLVVVIDEFQNVARCNEHLLEELFLLQEWLGLNRTVLTILVSSSVYWVENRMMATLGTVASFFITTKFKLGW